MWSWRVLRGGACIARVTTTDDPEILLGTFWDRGWIDDLMPDFGSVRELFVLDERIFTRLVLAERSPLQIHALTVSERAELQSEMDRLQGEILGPGFRFSGQDIEFPLAGVHLVGAELFWVEPHSNTSDPGTAVDWPRD